jgi:hypothetical protein
MEQYKFSYILFNLLNGMNYDDKIFRFILKNFK